VAGFAPDQYTTGGAPLYDVSDRFLDAITDRRPD